MRFVDAKCPNCGAVLKVDESKEAAICEHCGSAFIIEKAIQQFNITNIINNNITAHTVNIYTESDFAIEAHVLKRYKGADSIVHIPDNVKISECVFPEGVKEIYYPDSVIAINNRFPKSLEAIRLPSGVTRLPDSSFENCENLKQVVLPASLKAISENCFKNCKSLKTIELPNGIETIGRYAFQDSGLCSINLPKTIKTIGLAALSKTKIERIEIPGIKECGYFCSSCEELKTAVLSQGITKIYATFRWCSKLENVNIPRGVVAIEDAFQDCKSLTKLFIPSTVTSISEHAFDGCKMLTIYCETKKPAIGQPKGWHRNWAKDVWNKPAVKNVVWGMSEEEFNKLL